MATKWLQFEAIAKPSPHADWAFMWRRGEYLIPDLTSIEATQRSQFSGRIRCRARSLMPILRSNPSLPARGRTLRVLSPLRLQYITKRAPIRVPFLLCMEARGVEPLSEDIATQVSTGVLT